MKILHIITSLKTGGAEKLLLDSIPLYVKEGFTIDLLLLNGADSIFLESLKKQNVCNIFNLGCGSVYNPLFIFKIHFYLKQYDLVHAHLFPTLYWVSLASILGGVSAKLVYTEHSTHNKRRDKNWLRPFEKLIYSKFDEIVCISEETKNNLNFWLGGKMSQKIKVIHNGVDLLKFKEARPYDKTVLNLPLDSKVILMTARFNIQKDPNTVIRAFHKLDMENAYLIFVGDGVLRQESEELSELLNIKDKVLFLGIRNDIPQLVKMADVCVLSSNWEGFGLVAIEYMAAKRPTIVSNIEGLGDIVKGAGLLFEKGDDEDLKDKMSRLLCDKDMYNNVASQCYYRSLDFGIDKMIASYMETYKELLQ